MHYKVASLVFVGMLTAGALARASETQVTCTTPILTVNSGQDGTSPRLTVQCRGGSTASPITFFAYQISANTTVALLLERAYADAVAQHKGALSTIVISSNLSDTSGAAWGCGASNCRIIDYIPVP